MPQQAAQAPQAPAPEPAEDQLRRSRPLAPRHPAAPCRQRPRAPLGAAPHLWRDRSRHQQLPPADRPADRGRLHRHRCLLARRPARRGPGDHGQLSEGAMDRAVAALAVCAEKLRRRRVIARPLGRDRGLPPRGQRPPFRRAGAARDRHRARDHRRPRRKRGWPCSAATGCSSPATARR